MDFFFNNIFPLMFIIVPVFVIGMFIFVFAKIFRQWNSNNKSPVLNVQATVVDKYSSHSHSSGNHHHTTTHFYIVFEVQSGDRLDFSVDRMQYSQHIEGDVGELIFQGSRFIDFQRTRAGY